MDGAFHENIKKKHEVTRPSDAHFGMTLTAVIAIITIYSYWKHQQVSLGWSVALVMSLMTWLLFPMLLTPFNILWHQFGLLLSRIMNPLIMGVFYFLVLTPFALAFRLFSKQGMAANQASTWQEAPNLESNMENQF